MSISNDLRQAVLQAAIQGKLTKQLPEDGNAKNLLEQIKAEKAKLVIEGKLKKEKPLQEITEDEKPFVIPENWEWCRLIDIATWGAGATPAKSNPDYYGGNIPWLLTGDLNNSYIDSVDGRITELALKETSVKLNPVGSVLIAMYGATIGKLGILNIEATTNQACCAGVPYNGMYNKFLFYFLMAHKPEFIKRGEGGAQPNISREKIIVTLMPLPPLSEQKRIVAKVEELMAKIDDLEKTEKELEALKKAFPADMKAALLQAAMQGKLTEQLPEDGNAKDLLEQIKAEKAKLIKEGKLKKEKPLPEITEDDKPFDIPENWEWVRLGDILLKLTDGAHSTPKYFSKGVPFISVKDVSSGNISFSDCKYISEQEHNELYKRCNPEKGDVLLTKVGTTGIPVIVDTEIEFSLFVSVALLKFNQSLLFNRYLVDLIKAPVVQKQAEVNTKGVGNKNWVMRDIANTMLPLPPFAEQKRIVEKLEKLLPLCDGLKYYSIEWIDYDARGFN